MKKNLLFLPLVLAGLAVSSCSKYDDSALTSRVTNVEGRVSKLEEQVKALNSDIVAIRTLITALQNNDYVTKVEPITEVSRSGYRISFTKSNPITIFHGTNGRDGQNGANGRDGVNGTNGRDGVSPVIGVRQEGGIYYWTLNGEWLTDPQGQKVKAQGTDGRDGQDGAPGTPGRDGVNGADGAPGRDGQDGAPGRDGTNGADGAPGRDGVNGADGAPGRDGQDGASGRDGVTPKLKIENEYWYVSYDNGKTWNNLRVKARGDKGETGDQGAVGAPGAAGSDGRNGDSFFQGIEQQESYVIFTLVDGVTTFRLPKYTELSLTFAKRNYAIFPGKVLEIPYSLIGGNEDTEIEVIIQGAIQAEVIKENTQRGYIRLKSQDGSGGRVILLATDMRGYTKMYTLSVYAGVLSILSDSYTVDRSGGTIVVPLQTNVEYSIDIPEEVRSWLSVENLRTAVLKSETIQFSVATNATKAQRVAKIPLKVNGVVVKELVILQEPEPTIFTLGPLQPSLEKQLAGIFPRELRLSGYLDSDDCLYLRTSGMRIQTLDLQGVKGFLPSDAFSGMNVTEVKLPPLLESIPPYCFERSAIRRITIPASVREVGDGAFKDCKNLEGSLNLPQKLQRIGFEAYSGCVKLQGSLRLPEALSEIGGGAFRGCSGLRGDLIFDHAVQIGHSAFQDCTGFQGKLVFDFGSDEGQMKVESGAFRRRDGRRLNFTAVYLGFNVPEIDVFVPELGGGTFWGGVGEKIPKLYMAFNRFESIRAWELQFENIDILRPWPEYW